MRRHDLDRVSDMLVLVRAVEGGSLSAAGRSLGITPAVASKRILRLEDRLGVHLLHRTSRHLSLTEAGRAYHTWSLHILEALEQAEAAAIEGLAKARSHFRVTATVAFGRKHVAPALAEFAEQHPDITVELALTDSVLDLVENRIDMAIRIGVEENSNLIARRLTPNRRLVCASPDYLARHPAPAAPNDLVQHNCLVLDRPNERQDVWSFGTPSGPVTVRVSGSLQSNSGEVLHDWALAGRGLVWKSRWDVSDDLRTGRLVEVLNAFPSSDRDIYAIYVDRKLLSVVARAFLDFMVRRFSQEPYWERDRATPNATAL